VAVFTLKSEEHSTRSNLKDLYIFLADFKNFAAILPQDKVQNFVYSENECSFHIKVITPMTVRLKEKIPYSAILFTSDGLGKFNFKLKAEFIGEAEEKGRCSVELEGELNPIIKNMVEKPLTALVNTMSQRLSELELKDIQNGQTD